MKPFAISSTVPALSQSGPPTKLSTSTLTAVAVVAPHMNATTRSLAGSGSARSIQRNAARTMGTGKIARPSDSANPGAPAVIPSIRMPNSQTTELMPRVIRVVTRRPRPGRGERLDATVRGSGCTTGAVCIGRSRAMVMVTPVGISALPLSVVHRLGATTGPRGDTFGGRNFGNLRATLPRCDADARPYHATDAVTGRYREPVEGTPFGRYRLIELLGRGGMGEVWRAYDSDIDRVVALKMLLPHISQDPDYEKRFRREARAAARLDDPHVVPIYDVGEIDGRLYVTMRLISGTDLHTLLESGPLDAHRAVAIIEQIA